MAASKKETASAGRRCGTPTYHELALDKGE